MITAPRSEGIGLIPLEPPRPRLSGGQSRGSRVLERPAHPSRRFAHKLYYEPSDFAVVDRVTEIARSPRRAQRSGGAGLILAQPGVTAPIIGASKPHHLEDALAALDLKLTEEELRSLAEPYRPHRVLGHS